MKSVKLNSRKAEIAKAVRELVASEPNYEEHEVLSMLGHKYDLSKEEAKELFDEFMELGLIVDWDTTVNGKHDYTFITDTDVGIQIEDEQEAPSKDELKKSRQSAMTVYSEMISLQNRLIEKERACEKLLTAEDYAENLSDGLVDFEGIKEEIELVRSEMDFVNEVLDFTTNKIDEIDYQLEHRVF